ncbi:uncharacterized protein PG986_006932 [Apiospora aurea]|uniref:Uncharacterized protein n=1 Tax=Apiospora aurea TaxID=335848 RepID=A0ABR1QB50_9PEZI
MSRSPRPVTAIYSPPSQEPAASFDVIGVYRTETLAKNELEPVAALSKSNFLDGEVYDNSNDVDMVSAPEPSDHHRRSRRCSRGSTATAARSGSRSSCRSLSPARMLEKSAEYKDRFSVAFHDLKEDQKARAGIIPPDPNRVYPSYYNGYGARPQERREHRAPEQREHHHRQHKEEGDRHHQRRRTRRISLQQQQPPPPSQTAPVPTIVAQSPSSSSSSSSPPPAPSSSFASRMAASANASGLQQKQRRMSAYRPEKANEAIPYPNDVAHAAPVTSRREQERQELFCRATQRGGRPEHFLRQPGVGVGSAGGDIRQQQKTAPATATATAPVMVENPSAALCHRAQEKINGQRPSAPDFDRSRRNSSSIDRFDSLYLPRSNKAAATANAAVPESHRQSFSRRNGPNSNSSSVISNHNSNNYVCQWKRMSRRYRTPLRLW